MLIARIKAALVPWYDWGRFGFIESLDGAREAKDVHFFTLEWLGFHFQIQFGLSVPTAPKEMHDGI